MTAEEYLDKHQWMMSDQSIVIYVSDLDAYKSLVEKEAVKEFAEELIKGMTSDNDPIDIYIKIKRLAKQKGVEI